MVDINNHFFPSSVPPQNVGDGASVKPVPKHHTIDTSSLSSEGLQALKKHDPFLYNSIPGVHAAACLNEKVDTSSIQSSISVERRSCVSVEVDILNSLKLKVYDEGNREPTKDWSDDDNDVPVCTKRRRRWSFTYGAAFQKAF